MSTPKSRSPKSRSDITLCGVQHNRHCFRTPISNMFLRLRVGPNTEQAMHSTHYVARLVPLETPCNRLARALPLPVGAFLPSLHGSPLCSLTSGWPMLGVALLLCPYAIVSQAWLCCAPPSTGPTVFHTASIPMYGGTRIPDCQCPTLLLLTMMSSSHWSGLAPRINGEQDTWKVGSRLAGLGLT